PAVWIVAPFSVLFCFLLMAGLPVENWIRFVLWLAIGLVVYFGYGRRNSQLENTSARGSR
ncbi:MAG TPA: amino acid permease C-terminal domain-containing protein, partial [Candidatus Acidoferrales bacterium]|nr:amino acid permease C-terminal domain-containing protein [Candidatus Acidoferrales bacterium]